MVVNLQITIKYVLSILQYFILSKSGIRLISRILILSLKRKKTNVYRLDKTEGSDM